MIEHFFKLNDVEYKDQSLAQKIPLLAVVITHYWLVGYLLKLDIQEQKKYWNNIIYFY